VQPIATTGAGNLSCWCLMKSDRLADSLPIRELWATNVLVPYHSRHSSRCRARVRKWPAFTLCPSGTLAPVNSLKLALMKIVVVLRRAGRAKAKKFWGKSCVFCAQDGFKPPLNWLRMLNVVTQINSEARFRPIRASGRRAGPPKDSVAVGLTAAKCRNGQRRKPVKLGKPFCSKTYQSFLTTS